MRTCRYIVTYTYTPQNTYTTYSCTYTNLSCMFLFRLISALNKICCDRLVKLTASTVSGNLTRSVYCFTQHVHTDTDNINLHLYISAPRTFIVCPCRSFSQLINLYCCRWLQHPYYENSTINGIVLWIRITKLKLLVLFYNSAKSAKSVGKRSEPKYNRNQNKTDTSPAEMLCESYYNYREVRYTVC